MSIKRVDTAEAARALAARLNSTERTVPAVVVTTAAGRTESTILVDRLYADVGDAVEIYLLPTGEPSWAFSEAMPARTQVYGGAGRAYPVGLGWVHNPFESPLRFAFNTVEGERSTRDLASDALTMAAEAGLIGQQAPAQAMPVTGQVKGVIAGRGMVRTADGGLASIVEELTVPGVSVERVVVAGMFVTGTCDDAQRLDIRGMLRPVSELGYAEGQVVLARVRMVSLSTAQLELHPEVRVDIARVDVTSNELDDLTGLMTEGEVLRGRVTSIRPWRLSLRDIDDDETVEPAFALIDGGPPWLVEGLPQLEPEPEPEPVGVVEPASPAAPPAPTPAATMPAPRPTPAIFDRKRKAAEPAVRPTAVPEPEPVVEAPAAVSAGPRPGPPPPVSVARLQGDLERVSVEVRSLRGDLAALRDELRLVDEERTKAQTRVVRLEIELARTRTRLRSTRSQPAPPEDDDGPWFSDPEHQFRYEVEAAWVRRIPPGQKGERPLHAYALGPNFLSSVVTIQGISRHKIVDVVVEVLTGIAIDMPAREVHPLWSAEVGGAGSRIRSDGATCMRVRLQAHTPSARRLHYWQLVDGMIEFSRVVVHDDFEP